MYKLSCCFLLAAIAANGFCLILTEEDDKENILLLFSDSADSPVTLLTDNNTALINNTKKTVFLVHGWRESQSAIYYPIMFAEYTKKGGYNVIRVDWSKYSNTGYVIASQILVERVGNFLGNYIHTLENSGVNRSEVHIVGHSLGAHIGGFAGKKIKSLSGSIGRITGLDPAGPLFGFFANSDNKLGPEDADMVHCLYTNRGFYGTLFVLGTHNFYANNAEVQPGCSFYSNNTRIFLCSHQRSTSLFSESINSNNFIAVKIERFVPFEVDNNVKVVFGENTNASEGSYYFETNPSEPYALG